MIRTLKPALEGRLKRTIEHDSPILPWLVEYPAVLLNLFRVGKDQRTPMERHTGDKHLRPIAEFGESVWCMPWYLKSNPVSTPDVRFHDGVWLRMDQRTSEVIIGTPSGVVRARVIKRKLEDARWNAEEVSSVKGTPWNPVPGVDPEALEAAVRVPLAPEEATQPVTPPTEPGLMARRTRLIKKDFMKHGFTSGCKGCEAIEKDLPSQNHSSLCRSRIEAEISKDPEGRERIEAGYSRLADAAMRISLRQQAEATVQANASPAASTQPSDFDNGLTLRKRARGDGSVTGSAPGSDEAAARAEIPQDAPGNPCEPTPSEFEFRGMKRPGEVDDSARDVSQRLADDPQPEPTSSSAPEAGDATMSSPGKRPCGALSNWRSK